MSDRAEVAAIVPHGTLALLERYADLLIAENARQNLIARSTIEHLWTRHILDSLQLIDLAPPHGRWIDIGSGGGLPGFVVALATERPVLLVEPRTRRAEFLRAMVEEFGLRPRVDVSSSRIESVDIAPASVISARAVASLSDLLTIGAGVSNRDTCWLLPKGRNARAEVEVARKNWHGRFDLIPSRTDAESLIVVVRDACPRGKA